MLGVASVTVQYDGHCALDGVDLEVGAGEIVAVLGPSGAGKSTLLRVIAGLELPTAGTVSWGGADLAGVPPHRRQVGLMFQDHALFPHRNVIANVAFGLRMRGAGRVQASARARELLALVGLAGYETRRVQDLSGGEQQRVALARALAPAPRLLMLDEPLGSLDRRLRDELTLELRDLLTGLGLTVLLVTHDHDEAFAIADRVAVMRAGRVDQIGTAAEVWRRPATAEVARFLGYNVFDGVAARPEHLRLDARGSLAGVVTGVTFRREHFLLRVRVEREPDVALITVVVHRHDSLPDVGDGVRVAVDRDAIVKLAAPS